MQTWGVGDPADKPTFDGLTSAGKVISLATNSNSAASAAVTADGAVHIWVVHRARSPPFLPR